MKEMVTKLEPILNRVVLKRLSNRLSKGGLVIAPDGQKSADRAMVVAVGPGMMDLQTGNRVPCTLVPGDQVLINAYLGMTSTIDGEEVIIQKEEEILCKELSNDD